MKLWPLFGTANQLLAALALLIVTICLKHRGGLKYLVSAIPCLIILLVTNWAMLQNEMVFLLNENWLLVVIGAGIFALALWMTVEAFITFFSIPTVFGAKRPGFPPPFSKPGA